MESTNQTLDPYEGAFDPTPNYEVYGQVRVDAHFIAFPGNKQKPVPFDPSIHSQVKCRTEYEFQLIPIAEQNISWDEHQRVLKNSSDWQKVISPSIQAIGIDDLRALNNQWVRVAKVPSNRKRLDKETQEETGEFWPTYKFMELFADEAACKAAFGGHTPADTKDTAAQTAQGNKDTKAAALTFLKVFVSQAAKHITDRVLLEKQIATDIANNSLISPLFTVQSPEVQTAIDEALAKFA